ncbi:MAG TPA: response regulator transcription factor, partial [Jatrophihabitantaceae bacterium]|nr:response regulator transcription factor [Jatrophihabitantaceae bacterium]
MIDAAPTVVVVDDALDLREVVRIRLELSGLFRVIGEAANGVEAVELATRLKPDLMLLDVSMPVMDGLEALPQIILRSPSTRVVMFTGFDERGLATRARALGATALLEKSTSIEELPSDLLAILDRAGLPVAELTAEPTPVAPSDLSPQEILGEHLERFREVFEEAAIGMGTMTL